MNLVSPAIDDLWKRVKNPRDRAVPGTLRVLKAGTRLHLLLLLCVFYYFLLALWFRRLAAFSVAADCYALPRASDCRFRRGCGLPSWFGPPPRLHSNCQHTSVCRLISPTIHTWPTHSRPHPLRVRFRTHGTGQGPSGTAMRDMMCIATMKILRRERTIFLGLCLMCGLTYR